MSRRHSRQKGFSLIDALVGILLLSLSAALLFSGFTDLSVIVQRQEVLVQRRSVEVDMGRYEAWF